MHKSSTDFSSCASVPSCSVCPHSAGCHIESNEGPVNQQAVNPVQNSVGTIKAVCTSDIKGIQKTETDGIDLRPDWGIEDDAHAGNWHRQVSLLGYERIEEFKALGAEVGNGAFGENIIVEGFDLKSLPLGTRFKCGDVVLELTQIGKECHAHCAIYHKMGDCIMPREGVFCKVLEGGHIAPGDKIEIVE